jgi:hypothetical protein
MMVLRVLFVVAACLFGANVSADRLSHSWGEFKFAACPGIGAGATFRTYVEGQIDKNKDGTRTIDHLEVWFTSAAFGKGPVFVAAKATVKASGLPDRSVTLERPTGMAFEAPVKPGESHRVYLPEGTRLTLPPNAKLSVKASPLVKLDVGDCVLGTSESDIPLQ